MRLAVVPVELVPKAQIAEDPKLATHQIVTAPMGTVFPLDHEELGRLLSLTGRELPSEVRHSVEQLPRPLAWAQRYKSDVFPIPGSVEDYVQTLAQILTYVNEQQPTQEDLNRWIGQTFDVSSHR